MVLMAQSGATREGGGRRGGWEAMDEVVKEHVAVDEQQQEKAAVAHEPQKLDDLDEDMSTADARTAMSRRLGGQSSSTSTRSLTVPPRADDDGMDEEYARTVHRAIEFVDKDQGQQDLDALSPRAAMVIKSNTQLTLSIVLHKGEATQTFLAQSSFTESATFLEFRKVVKARCGDELKSNRFPLVWNDPSGATIELNHLIFDRFVLLMWCAQPWVIHVYDEERYASSGPVQRIRLVGTGTTLFERYDVDASGRVDKRELIRLLMGLDLKRLNCSPKLIERFVVGEYERLDTDRSGNIGLAEFIDYVTSMTSWMRSELMLQATDYQIFTLRTSRGIQFRLDPQKVPGRGKRLGVVDCKAFGIRLEIPEGGKPADTVAIATLPPSAVEHMSDDSPLGEFIFSPVVSVEYPKSPEARMGDEFFKKPLTLIMPHCFEESEARSSCVMLGARHGAVKWERIDKQRAGFTPEPILFEKGLMRVQIPYAGATPFAIPIDDHLESITS